MRGPQGGSREARAVLGAVVQFPLVCLLVAPVVLAPACRRAEPPPGNETPPGAGAGGVGTSAVAAVAESGEAATAPAELAAPTGAPSFAPTPAAPEPDGIVAEVVEENLQAPNVRLRLEVVPKSARAQVFWGRKNLGQAPLDLQWPRRSGPLEIVVRAEGYLDFHTRLFTDRDDRWVVRMVTPAERSSLLGYRRTAEDLGGKP